MAQVTAIRTTVSLGGHLLPHTSEIAAVMDLPERTGVLTQCEVLEEIIQQDRNWR